MRDERTTRILDATQALLSRFGYRRVTVDDVARKAGVGKGTVYLHWPSKLDLCGSVLTRLTIQMITEDVAALEADPAEVLLHRSLRRTFLQFMQQPLAKAFARRDFDVLGELMMTNYPGLQFASGKIETTEWYLSVLSKYQLLAEDVTGPRSTLPYRISTVVTGAVLLEDVSGTEDLNVESMADALATTLRSAFEPIIEPSPDALRGASNELAGLYKEWTAQLKLGC